MNKQSEFEMNQVAKSKKIVAQEQESKEFRARDDSAFRQFLSIFRESEGDIDTFMVKIKSLPLQS